MGKIFTFLLPIFIYVAIYIDYKNVYKDKEGFKFKIYRYILPLGFIYTLVSGLINLFTGKGELLIYYSKIIDMIIFISYLIVTRFNKKER